MKKSLILISALVVLAVLVGCNADQISGFGKGLEKVGDLGLGQRRKDPMNEAIENVKTFIAESEKSFIDPPTQGQEFGSHVDGYPDSFDDYLSFINTTEMPMEKSVKHYIDTVDQTVSYLLAAKDSSAGSKALRTALNARYTGLTKDVAAYKNLHAGLSHESALGSILRQVDLSIPENRNNVVMLLHFILKTDIGSQELSTIENGINTLKTTNLPFPVQASDYSLMVGQLFPQLQSIIEAAKTESSGSGESKFDKTALVNFQNDIATSVGDRDYQTVGDKIAVGIVYSLMSTIIDINTGYTGTPDYNDAPSGHKYDKFFEYLLTNGKGLGYVDKMLNYLDAISYVYDVKLDLTGLVSGMV